MSARIYSPAKTAMQSGLAKTGRWVLEFNPAIPLTIDPLMGYTSSRDMNRQVRLSFETREEAVSYARKNGIAFRIEDVQPIKRRVVSYSDNFRYDRKIPWTH